MAFRGGEQSPQGMPSVGLFVIVGELLFFFGEAGEALAAQRLPQLDEAAGLDLPDALAGDAVAARHFIQRPRLAVAQPKAKLDHFALALRQRAQHFADAVAQEMLIGGLARTVDAGIIEEIAERALGIVA